MNENKNAIAYVSNLISGLLPTAEIRFALQHHVEYRFIIGIENNNIDIYFGRDVMDDFEVALEKYRDTNYYHTLENRIKFQIYVLLGKEGLLSGFDISPEILCEKGEWIEYRKVDVEFEEWFCEIMYEGLKLLSNFLDTILSGTSVELKEMEAEKVFTDDLIKYYEDNKHLRSSGAKIQNLSFLKAAAVCMIIEKEISRKETTIPRLRKGYDKEIYDIVSEIRQDSFKDIKLPECIYDYAAQRETGMEDKQKIQEMRPTIGAENSKLDQLLEKLGPRLRERREGAWLTFRSDNPDRLSQSANSMVELLDKVISQVCQNTELSVFLKNKYQTHEKTDWVDVTRKWISETKSNLHRVKHHVDNQSEKLTEVLLRSVESIILVILE